MVASWREKEAHGHEAAKLARVALRKRGRTVEAPNEKAAQAAAVAEFELSDEQRRRLVVQERN